MHTILVIDDSKTNLQILRNLLGGEYTVLLALSGEVGVRYLEKRQVDLILLDLLMPGMDGKETLQAIRKRPGWAKIPIIFLTASGGGQVEAECIRIGACDFISKPFVPEVLLSRISRTLELEDYRKALTQRLLEKTWEAENLALQAITTIANTLDAKDAYSKGHSARVAVYAEKLAGKLGWAEERCRRLRRIALLHDVGKIGVPDSILKKTSRLSEEEFLQIKTHSDAGATILKDISTMPYLAIGARFHHERYDGNGYPQGLRGEEIPEEARVIGVADAYDAMTSDRCYRRRMTNETARDEILANAGRQFDPHMAEVFAQMIEEGEISPIPNDEGVS